MHLQWECKIVQPLWKIVRLFLKKANTELPYNTVILLLDKEPPKLKRETQLLEYQYSKKHYSQQPKGKNNPSV